MDALEYANKALNKTTNKVFLFFFFLKYSQQQSVKTTLKNINFINK